MVYSYPIRWLDFIIESPYYLARRLPRLSCVRYSVQERASVTNIIPIAIEISSFCSCSAMRRPSFPHSITLSADKVLQNVIRQVLGHSIDVSNCTGNRNTNV